MMNFRLKFQPVSQRLWQQGSCRCRCSLLQFLINKRLLCGAGSRKLQAASCKLQVGCREPPPVGSGRQSRPMGDINVNNNKMCNCIERELRSMSNSRDSPGLSGPVPGLCWPVDAVEAVEADEADEASLPLAAAACFQHTKRCKSFSNRSKQITCTHTRTLAHTHTPFTFVFSIRIRLLALHCSLFCCNGQKDNVRRRGRRGVAANQCMKGNREAIGHVLVLVLLLLLVLFLVLVFRIGCMASIATWPPVPSRHQSLARTFGQPRMRGTCHVVCSKWILLALSGRCLQLPAAARGSFLCILSGSC